MLPDIKIALPLLFVLWCVGSVWAIQSAVLLIYPAMWAAVSVAFLVATKLLSGSSSDAG